MTITSVYRVLPLRFRASDGRAILSRRPFTARSRYRVLPSFRSRWCRWICRVRYSARFRPNDGEFCYSVVVFIGLRLGGTLIQLFQAAFTGWNGLSRTDHWNKLTGTQGHGRPQGQRHAGHRLVHKPGVPQKTRTQLPQYSQGKPRKTKENPKIT